MILFNNKEADLNNKKTYRRNIKFSFDGSALLLKLDRHGKIKKALKIGSGYKLKRNGNYELILNDKVLIHFLLKKRLLVIIFLIGLLFTSFYFGYMAQDLSYNPNDYVFDTSNIEFKHINLIDTYKSASILDDKIAPGTIGNFNIVINNKTNSQYRYSFIYKESNEKPERTIL